ncbi:unnamed protein product [Bemisia tabaci]|uniref:Sugar transporter n=1 Tax=Bemisia tabaci TaxID=7038 RepID=A0A9N9ZZQ5_BEMTA|nr:unnamed protein product [Bemisia tabaci]
MCHPSNPSKNVSIEDGPAEANVQHKYTRRSAFAQILATLIQNWLLIEIGLDWAMPTMVIGALHRNSEESFNMDDDEASWFGSIPSICHPLASLSSGYFQELLGRKSTMILVTIPTCAAWITLYFAQSVQTLYLVAGTMGICTGLTEAPLHSYIGEIGEPHLRGSLSTLSQSAGFIGVFLMYLLCYFYDWRTVALICSACPIITFTSMTQIPESPTWLIVKGRLEEAKKSLCWLRGWVKPCEVEEEFQTLLDHTKKSVKSIDSTQMVEDCFPDLGICWCYDERSVIASIWQEENCAFLLFDARFFHRGTGYLLLLHGKFGAIPTTSMAPGYFHAHAWLSDWVQLHTLTLAIGVRTLPDSRSWPCKWYIGSLGVHRGLHPCQIVSLHRDMDRLKRRDVRLWSCFSDRRRLYLLLFAGDRRQDVRTDRKVLYQKSR